MLPYPPPFSAQNCPTTGAQSNRRNNASAKVAPPAAKVADLHFLGGHWEGHVDKTRIEQTCSISDPTVMVCMFQLIGEKGTQMIEFYTLRDTPDGVEERIRFYSPDLKADAGDGVTMNLVSSSPTTLVSRIPPALIRSAAR